MGQAVKVPLLDLKAQYLSIKDEIDAAVARVHERGNYVMGQEVEAFEEEWRRYCGALYCVGVSSGTDAIYLALRALRSPKEQFPSAPIVHIPAFTFPGVIEPVVRALCQFRLVDVEEDTALMQVPSGPLGKNWAMPTSLYGRPLGWGWGGNVLEDACQAHGAPTWATVRVYSFYPSKNLGAYGQAGAVVTDNPDIAKAVTECRVYGERERFVYHTLSANYRMDEMQAAILRAKLPHLYYWNLSRKKVASGYLSRLQGLPGIVVPPWVPDHVYHIFVIRVTDPRGRDNLARFLAEQGIQTAVRYPVPLHRQPALSLYTSFPNAETWARENLSLPIWPEMSLEAVEYVCEKVKEWSTKEARDP